MASISELTSYTGNAGLGSGSNPGIPVSPTGNDNVVNEAGKNAMLLNAETNRQLFQQKVKDHNDLMNAIASGDLKVGEMLDKDRKTVQPYLDNLDAAWLERGKKGFNNIEAATKYNKALREAQDAVTQAQTRYATDIRDRADISKEVDDKKRAAKQQNLDNYESGFWNDYTPYQQTLDFNHPELTQSQLRDALVDQSKISPQVQGNKKYVVKTETDPKTGQQIQKTWDITTNQPVKGTVPKNQIIGVGKNGQISPFSTVPGKYYDYDKILANSIDDFSHDTKQQQYQQMYNDYLLGLPDAMLNKVITGTNSRIDDYNSQRGNQAVAKISYVTDNNGQKHFVDETGKPLSLPEVNAKLALASISGDYTEQPTTTFNKDIGSYLMEKNRLGLDWTKFNYAKDEDKYGANSVLNEAKDIINKGTPQDVYNKSTGKTETRIRIADPNLLKSFGTVDKDGNVTNPPDYLEYDKDNNQVTLGYYAPQKRGEAGRNIEREVKLDQRTWLKEIAKRSFPNKDIGKINTLVDDVLNQNDNSLYKLSQKGNTTSKIPNGWESINYAGKTYYTDGKGNFVDEQGNPIKK